MSDAVPAEPVGRYAEVLASWLEDPVLFVRECFGAEPDTWQKDALYSARDNQRTAMISNKGPGKSCDLAWTGWWFETTHPNAQGVATSVTAENLRDGLWKELNYWHSKSRLLQTLFECGKERIELKANPGQCWISARTWPKDASAQQQSDSLAGFHADNTIFLCDEAGGYPRSLMATIEASLAGPGVHRIVAAGNPTHTEGYALFDIATRHSNLWKPIYVTGDPDDPKRSSRVPVEWARQQIEMWGRDNPHVLVNVFGKFPPSGSNALLGPSDVAAAQKRNPMGHEYEWAQKRLGVDVARFGDDATVIYPRQGLVAFEPVEMRGAKTTEVAARVAEAKRRWGSEVELIDDTGGYGAGVIDVLMGHGYSPMGVNFASRPSDERFNNVRTEMWWRMAEWVRKGGALPASDEQLARELTAPTYDFKNGKLCLEEKAQIKKRLGFSPDHADALALTFLMPEMPAMAPMPFMEPAGSSRCKQDFDPFKE